MKIRKESEINFETGKDKKGTWNCRQILDSFKLKEFADDNFEFDENGRKFSKWVENTVGKGEIARYKCLQKICTADTKKPGPVRERVNPS